MIIACNKETGVCSLIGSIEGTDENKVVWRALADGESTLAVRYGISEETGEIVDRFPGMTDDEVLAALEPQPPQPEEIMLSKPKFLELFTLDELAGLYAARDTDLAVQIFMDRLDMVEEIDVKSKTVVDAVNYMVSKGYLTPTRGDQILRGEFPA